jgi:hypothetical protein
MSKEIRLPEPHPRFTSRRRGKFHRVDHPGTAIRIEGELFEIVHAKQSSGQWAYSLEPWDEQLTPRVCVEWGPQAEKEFLDASRRERIREKKSALAWTFQVLLGFLPEKHQRRLETTLGLDAGRATYLSAWAEFLVSLAFPVMALLGRLGGEQGAPWLFRMVIKLPLWLVVLSGVTLLEGLFRLVWNIASGDPVGSFLLAIVDLKFSRTEREDLNADDYSRPGSFFIARTPVPKKHWERWKGVNFEDKDFALKDVQRIHMSWLYRFEESRAVFPVITPESERSYNVASDRSFVLAPLWGFLPPDLQGKLSSYGRYAPPAFVKLSISINLAISLPALVVDVFAFASGHAALWNLLRGIFAVCLLHETLLRLAKYSRDREVTGSFLAFLVKPVYYMAFKDMMDR